MNIEPNGTSTQQEREAAFHNRAYAEHVRAPVWGYYDITEASSTYFWSLIEQERPAQKRVLELGCGVNAQAFRLARMGARVTGIDISPVAVASVSETAKREGLSDRAAFRVMDGESLEFGDATFQLVCGSAIIHHLDPGSAYAEIARVLDPAGVAIFIEPLGHNPFINLYRRRTPDLRTADEHPLLLPELGLAREHFSRVEARFFHLTSLAAIPLRGRRLFPPLVRGLDALDRRLFALAPALRKHAWFTVFRLTGPMGG